MRPTKVRTIILAESCPLQCRYCISETRSSYDFSSCIPKDKVWEQVENYDKEDDFNTTVTKIEFSGGEPFLQWPLIRAIIEKYGTRFVYGFNTCGYPLTEEMLRFLSNYEVSFIFTMDGATKALADYVKPVRGSVHRVGYHKKVSEIIPALLYYFPDTPFRMVATIRYLDLIFEQYLAAENLGFRHFNLISNYRHVLNYRKRDGKTEVEFKDGKPIAIDTLWEPKHTEILCGQMGAIAQEILAGFVMDIARPRVVGIDQAVGFLLNEGKFTPESLPCQVMQGRTMVTHIKQTQAPAYCLDADFPDRKDLGISLAQEFAEAKKKGCALNPECKNFEYCAWSICPKDSFDEHRKFFIFNEFQCGLAKPYIESAIALLSAANEECKNSLMYSLYLGDIIKGKEAYHA